jgi:hypothetical protein
VDVDPVDINIFGFKLPSVAVFPSKFRQLIIFYRIILRMESCGTLTRLNGDILDGILTKLTVQEIFQLRPVCREFRDIIKKESFQRTCAVSSKIGGHHEHGSPSFSPIFFFLAEGKIEWMGYDNTSRIWQRLPSLGTMLPSPTPTLLMKDYFVTASGGLLCVNVSEDRHFECIIICNPLTQTKVELPPLKFRRQPVLLHLLVGSNHAYKVIAAGSAAMGTGNLSRKTEVYDSDTGELKLMIIGFVKTGDSLCLASIMITGLDPSPYER